MDVITIDSIASYLSTLTILYHWKVGTLSTTSGHINTEGKKCPMGKKLGLLVKDIFKTVLM